MNQVVNSQQQCLGCLQLAITCCLLRYLCLRLLLLCCVYSKDLLLLLLSTAAAAAAVFAAVVGEVRVVFWSLLLFDGSYSSSIYSAM